MEQLVPLTEVKMADRRHRILGGYTSETDDPRDNITLATRHHRMQEMNLPKTVPEDVRSAFAVARNVWLYGWFYWPFYTLARFHAATTVELALHLRCKQDRVYEKTGKDQEVATLWWYFQQALDRDWLKDGGFTKWQEWQEWDQEMPDSIGRAEARDPEAQDYTETALEAMRKFRNWDAHPDKYSHQLPGAGLTSLRQARDIIIQLFGSG